MAATAIITALALLQFILFGVQVGAMRKLHGVKAPAMSGHPEFERMLRVQQNTLEQLIVFIPALWLYAYYVNPWWGAGIGVLFLIGRFVFRQAYLKDPARRSPGFMLGMLPVAVLLVWALVAAVKELL